jgi:hypothetical protein
MSHHSDTLSKFWANQSLPFLLNAKGLAEEQQIAIWVFCLIQPGLQPSPTI